MKKEDKPYKIMGMPLAPLITIAIIMILFLPTLNYLFSGKFTWNLEEAIAFHQTEEVREMNCEWGAICDGLGMCYCGYPPCKTYNIESYKCVREGYTGEGFLGLGDYNHEYYVCEGLGRIAKSCSEYWSKEEYDKNWGLGENKSGI